MRKKPNFFEILSAKIEIFEIFLKNTFFLKLKDF